jgi:hypothetical protein
VEAANPRGAIEDRGQDAEPVEHFHARRLQEKASSDSPTFGGAFEDDHLVAQLAQKDCGGGTGRSTSDDGDTHEKQELGGSGSSRSGRCRRQSSRLTGRGRATRIRALEILRYVASGCSH